MKAEWTNRDNLSIETTGQNSKAMLVIECIPDNCGKCRLADFGKCWGSKSYIHLSTKDRPKECPLKPLPQKTYAEFPDSYKYGFADGWNACLEEIAK